MMSRLRAPRLLPTTIAVLAVVLATRSTSLIRSVIDSGQPAAFIAAAWADAVTPEKPAGKPGDKPAVKPDAKPGDPGQQTMSGPGAAKPPENAAPPTGADVPTGPPPMTDGEKAILLDLRERRRELDAREAALASRESMLAAAEQKIAARVGELQELQKKLETLDASHRQQEDTAWQGLVKVYETMKPRDAAVIFNDLGMPVLLAVVDRMKEAKAAAILAAMSPDKARDLTTQLAQLRTKAATVDNGDKPNSNPDPARPPGSGT